MLEPFGGRGFLRIPRAKRNGCARCGLETSKAWVTHFLCCLLRTPYTLLNPWALWQRGGFLMLGFSVCFDVLTSWGQNLIAVEFFCISHFSLAHQCSVV